ncbi:LysR family transcriptional regulator [Labrys sp. LIt4]|uniref:LysR family transcriptional regulator n=1 Tax=Labrys sp. LIt4 TaxID=2821355 RepID=UPI001ADF9D04|nr:LysR family transcriptional regulator [Labrys sp. LIt4]MBP0583205.1 LysR family transcriptional regulator [Labrys sp. LIt4]
MHPRLLKTFLAVARHRNVTRAAEAVHLAQSSVSDQIQALEAELGTPLFARSRSGLQLTAAGAALQPYAEEILTLTDEARGAVAMTAGQERGAVSIGALETIAAVRLPAWLSRFGQAHPEIALRLSVAGTGDLLRKLEDGEVDVVFCFDRGDFDERFATRSISREPLVLIAPAGEPPLPPGEGLAILAAKRFVVTEAGCVYRHLFDAAFARAGLAAPNLAAEAGSIGAIARLVAAGTGLGLVPRLAVADALARGEVTELSWPGPAQTAALAADLVMIWRRRRVQPPALKLLLASASTGLDGLRPGDARPRHAEPLPS